MVDLGFGQPMEHVLRQCLIALRLPERVGLDDEQHSVVNDTALLVNVGVIPTRTCRPEMRSLRAAAASLRLVGAGNTPFHRFRVGLEFALSVIPISTG